MSRFTPRLRPLPVDAPDVLQRLLEIANATGGFGLLEARVLRCALAHALAAQLRQRASGRQW
jgi:hypothetical protein